MQDICKENWLDKTLLNQILMTQKLPLLSKRIESIDLLRGVIMIIMVLDHTRDFFHADAQLYSPTDLSQTTPFLFFTRWITHFCAPVFYFLAGTAAFLYGNKKTKKQLSAFLFTRGIWLVILELTIINLGWTFNISLPFLVLITIAALGISMIVLAVLVLLPYKMILIISLLIIFGHNLLDNIHIEGRSLSAFFWAVLHDTRFAPDHFSFLGRTVEIAYPVLPWIGVMSAGYCTGKLYTTDFSKQQRIKWLRVIGVLAIMLFVLIRFINTLADGSP